MVGPVVFPLAKLGVLIVKQVSKPIAQKITVVARKSTIFRRWVCVPLGQLLHFYEVKLKMRILNMANLNVTRIPKLNEKEAMEQGSEVLSELLILGIAIAVLVHEYKKSKEEKLEEEREVKEVNEFINRSLVQLELKIDQHNELLCTLFSAIINQQEKLEGKKSTENLLENLKDLQVGRSDKSTFRVLEEKSETRSLDEKEQKANLDTEKSLSEEFVEFVEEVVEEILDVVNPDDEDD